MLSYVPEPKDLTFLDGGWAVGWGLWTGSFVTSPGGAPVHVRGTVLGVLKKLPDGSWKGFRGMGLLSRESVAGQVELTDTPPSKSLELTMPGKLRSFAA